MLFEELILRKCFGSRNGSPTVKDSYILTTHNRRNIRCQANAVKNERPYKGLSLGLIYYVFSYHQQDIKQSASARRNLNLAYTKHNRSCYCVKYQNQNPDVT